MKLLYTIAQIVSAVLLATLSFALIIESKVGDTIEWVNITIKFAGDWWILSIMIILLTLTGIQRLAKWEDEHYN